MKEVQPRLLVQHVAMHRCHVDAVCPQCLDNGIYLLTDENKIASNGSLACTGRLEVDRGGYTHRSDRRNLYSAFHDRVAARHAKLVNAAIRLALDANELVELRGVEINRGRR